MPASLKLKLTRADLNAVSDELARRDFTHYRKQIALKNRKQSWWQDTAAAELQQFYADILAGVRPKLIIIAPPQHGKSELIVDFISWVAGKMPDWRTIFASFSDRLGVRANLRLQRIYSSAAYRRIFPATRIALREMTTAANQWVRNRELLEYIDHEGYFRNTTIGGPITGEGLDLGVIDDPIKGREQANSEVIRNKAWDWLTDDFATRFADHAGMLVIQTRWHEDDPSGRLIENDPTIKILKFEAIAKENDPYGREVGEPLFPEHKSRAFLEERRAMMPATHWEALYQGNPILDEGDFFKPENIRIVDTLPKMSGKLIRYWDKAGTDGGGAFTAGALMGITRDGDFIIMDMEREQLSAGPRERLIRQTAERDGTGVVVWVEQEPGSSGKESAENTIRNLAGFTCSADPVTGDKEARAYPLAGQVGIGAILMLRGSWNKALIDEMRSFPNGKYKDQVDACSGAFNKLAVRGARLL